VEVKLGKRAARDSAPRQRPAFRPRNEQARSSAARPWARDPSEVDRALSSHARIERLVAEAAAAEGWRASAYGRDDPVFDLLLEIDSEGGPAVVVEAKSTVASNEEKQLRLALGQVLRYRQLLRRSGRNVIGMIAVERRPADERWIALCDEAGVLYGLAGSGARAAPTSDLIPYPTPLTAAGSIPSL
jgi:hypothetical protein